jgi:2-deoxy-D-gluconate 3-dehydrogenase
MGDRNLDFSGKKAVVTGGSRGLGKAIAAAMAEQGAQVVICGRKQENLDRAAQELQQRGLEVVTQVGNIGDAQQVAGLFQSVSERWGKLDILVNNVGMNILTPSVADVEEGLWNKILQTNLTGTFLASGHAVKLMKKGGGGRIVNISSVAARKASRGMGVYCVAKAGVEMLTRVLAVELATESITVNAVAPGVVKTDFSRPFWSNDSILEEITRGVPLRRIAETEDVVGAVLFLASDLASYITGEVITVDGGSMA